MPNTNPTAGVIPAQTTSAIGKSFSYTIPNTVFQDNDGDKLTYTAVQDDGTTLPSWLKFDSDTRTFSGTPVSGSQGSYIIKVTASDGFGGKISTSFTLTVPNAIPIVNVNIPNQQDFFVGKSYSFSLPANSFSDPDGDNLVYTTSLKNGGGLPSWLTFNQATQTFYAQPTTGSQGDYPIVVTANDRQGGIATQEFSLTVPYRGITLGATIPDQGGIIGIAFYYAIPENAFYAVDGGQMSYSATLQDGSPLPTWLGMRNGVFSGTPVEPVALQVKVTATDQKGGSASSLFKIVTKKLEASNTSPKVSETVKAQDQNAIIGNETSFIFPEDLFSNPSDAPLTYSAKLTNGEPLPTWLNFIPAERAFKGNPTLGTHVNELKIELNAKNIFKESASTSFKVVFQNRPPYVLQATIQKDLLIGQAFSFGLPFEDYDEDTLTFSLNKKNKFLELDQVQRKCNGIPQIGDEGDYTYTIKSKIRIFIFL